MSSNAFNQLDREYTEREDYLANRAEERRKETESKTPINPEVIQPKTEKPL